MKKLYGNQSWIGRSKAKSQQKKRTKHYRGPREKLLNPLQVLRLRQPLKKLDAPKNFSLIENAEEVICYFNEAFGLIEKQNSVLFSLTEIENLTPDAIAFYISNFNDINFHKGTYIEGNEPLKPELKGLLRSSGFFDHVKTKESIPKCTENLLLHYETHNKVENLIAREASKRAADFSLGLDRRFRPLYEVLIECMANTNNHAGLERKGVYDWWLFVYNDPERKCSCITFLDLGVGVFKSIPVNGFKLRFKKFISNNAGLVPYLFSGEISSRTGLSERGKGWPLIYRHSQNKNFQKFILISNDVYADLKSGKSKGLSNGFRGTLLYIELASTDIEDLRK